MSAALLIRGYSGTEFEILKLFLGNIDIPLPMSGPYWWNNSSPAPQSVNKFGVLIFVIHILAIIDQKLQSFDAESVLLY